ncbi:MAG: SnoaL-like polyketide cyclase [Nostoc sp.]|uniref:SnoaL-like polyketide cyclase n=1 Tax=Nostoc sp. TaxID=1180 RepID=UPI002FFB192B
MSSIDNNNLPLWVQNRDTVLEYSQNVQWRYGKKPDYTRSNEKLASESKYNHLQGSLAALVQNLVRSFDVEANFKTNPAEWLTIVQDKFRMSTNGGTEYTVADLVQSGTYKLLIGNTQHYRASEENFETSTNLFHTAFPDGFLWEVVKIYSTPPTITFKWRHWGYFHGAYKDYAPTGQMIEVIGISVVHITDDLKILSLEHYYDNNNFLDKLTSGGKLANLSQSKPAEGGIQPPGSLYQKFWAFIKQIFTKRKELATKNFPASSCPFAALLR